VNILIDALAIRRQKAGVGIYAKSLIDHLLRIDPGNHYFILAQNDDPDLNYRDRRNATPLLVSAKLFRKIPIRLLWEQFVLPFVLLWHRIDAVHSLHYSFPLVRFGTKQIVTLHDMTSFLFPEVHVRVKVWYFKFFIRAALKDADGVIFVSHSGCNDCLSLLGSPHRFSAVIHHGKEDRFNAGVGSNAIDAVRDKYGLPARFVLYIGTIEPRKNLTKLMKAFAPQSSKHPDLAVVIAGMKGWNNEFARLQQLIHELDLDDRVIFPGFVDESDKPALLAAAEIFVYPSLYEGFGLPVLEAMACGVPTITSNTSSLVEVAGDAALMVNPTDHEEMGSALEALLSSAELRATMREAGIRQASQFSWARAAQETLSFYERITRHGS
jgi:glycosyltransferase involved in cell wall biosynthesis